MSDKWLLIIGIPLVALFAGMIFFLGFKDLHGSPIHYFLQGLLSTALIWLGCRFIIKFLWKKYPWHIHPVKHIIVEVFGIVIYLLIVGSLLQLLSLHIMPAEAKEMNPVFSITFTFLITFLIVAIHEGWFFFLQWKNSLIKSEKLEKENMQARFETLKNQVNPHFLFNSLNTLMTYIDDNKQATAFVQNLSDFFRSVLTTRDEEVVLLDNELKILEKYVFLQKSRFGNNLKVNFTIDKTITVKYFIPPLSLQMLVENAIKHNIISKEKPLFIDIFIENEHINIKNNLQRKKNPSSTGVGLTNIKNRYKFLSKKEVSVIETDNVFLVSVPLLNVRK